MDEHDDIEDDEPLWNCGCGLLVDGTLHCPDCGACAPWGCGMDHDEEEGELDVDPAMQGLFEAEMDEALGPPLWRDDDFD